MISHWQHNPLLTLENASDATNMEWKTRHMRPCKAYGKQGQTRQHLQAESCRPAKLAVVFSRVHSPRQPVGCAEVDRFAAVEAVAEPAMVGFREGHDESAALLLQGARRVSCRVLLAAAARFYLVEWSKGGLHRKGLEPSQRVWLQEQKPRKNNWIRCRARFQVPWVGGGWVLAVDETVILLHPPLYV